MTYRILSLCLTVFISVSAHADNERKQQTLEQHLYIEQLDRVNFLPSLLPVIIENSDIIELTDGQLQTLLQWREKNRDTVVHAMNEVTRKRLEIKEASLSPDISSSRLIQMQNEVFRLQREILEYKLSCRDLVINTFNRNNWESFFMVLAEEEIGVTIPEIYISKR
jgi:predicted RND superfamily exporter protein